MRLLLDTNVLIWWLEDDARLGPRARQAMANPANTVLATIVSIWEITIKWRIGKYALPGLAFIEFAEDEGVKLVGVTPDHVRAVETLAVHHKDPFDHLILAQAKVERARLITSDREMTLYGIACMSTD